MNRDDVRALLDYPDHTPPPDVAAIIARGRRARAARAVALTSSVAAAVVAVVVAAVVLVPDGPPGPPSDPAAAARGGSPPPGDPSADGIPTRFDPMTRSLRVGWLPDGLNGGRSYTAASQQMYSAFDDAYVNGGPDIGLVVTVLARGTAVEGFSRGALGLPRDAQPRPTEPVGGGRAECLSDPLVPAGTCNALRWEYAPGVWAQVSYAGSAGPTPEAAAAVARRVAESVTVGAPEPYRLPVRLSGELAEAEPISVGVFVADTAHPLLGNQWSAEVQLSTDHGDITVFCEWVAGGFTASDVDANTEVDGNPAVVDDEQSSISVYDVTGTRVAVRGSEGKVLEQVADVTVVDDPADPAGWPAVR